MSIAKEQQLEFIQEELRAWIKNDVEPALRAAIKRRENNIPEETLSNLRHQVLTDLGSSMAEYNLAFQDSGRMVDMRGLTFTKRPISQQNNFMLEWARKKGLNKFRKGVPGYTKGSKSKLTDDQKLERIASAMIVAKTKGNYKHRRRGQWYNKLIYKLIGRLTGRISRNQAAYFSGVMRDEIEKAFTQLKGPVISKPKK